MARQPAMWLCILALAVGPARAQQHDQPDLPQVRFRNAEFSDENVARAIQDGVSWLLKNQQDDGLWPYRGGRASQNTGGMTALCAYALLEAGLTDRDEAIAKALQALGGAKLTTTYAVGLRANAFFAADKDGAKYRKQLMRDRKLLLKGLLPNGAYTYSLARNRHRGDNSNAQYGVLGMWACARSRGMEIPISYWRRVRRYWRRDRNDDGGWGYGRGIGRSASYGAMTAAGVATLLVCMDNLDYQEFLLCRNVDEMNDIQAGIDWLARHFDSFTRYNRGQNGAIARLGHVYDPNGYLLYGLERVGLASGYKYFGEHDWYRELASFLLKYQTTDGSWKGGWADGGDLGATAYALLLLTRGQRPVAFNRLRYDGDWNNRPRALAHLSRHLSRRLERDLNWQIIHADLDVSKWHDAQILVITGSGVVEFSDRQRQRLRDFVHQGGTIVSLAECRPRGFRQSMRQVYKDIFGQYELQVCGPDHPLQNIQHKLNGRPVFYELSNGVRPWVIHCDEDIVRYWQMNLTTGLGKHYFRAAANLTLYITGKGRFHNRATSPWVGPQEAPAGRPIHVVRLAHTGQPNPEPLAWTRFERLMAGNEDLNVRVSEPTTLDQLTKADLAVISGTAAFSFNKVQIDALRKYIDGGGTLLIEAVGGSQAFSQAGRKLIAKLYPDQPPQVLPASSDVYQLPGRSIRGLPTRNSRRFPGRFPPLSAVAREGRNAIFISDLDLTTALLGVPCLRARGYTPDSAVKLLRNLVILAAGDKVAQPPAADPR